MTAARRTPAPGLGLVRAVRWLVPRDRRAEWEAEWRGEVEYYWATADRRGVPPALARASLLLRCAGAARDALWIRRNHGVVPMLGQDVRYAARMVARRPGFSATVVLTLALAIGANAAIFSVVNAVLLRGLPYPEPERLLMLWGEPREPQFAEKVASWWSLPDLEDTRRTQKSFESMAGLMSPSLTLTAPDLPPRRASAAIVTDDFFRTLRTPPELGRTLGPADEGPGAARAVVISHDLWQSRFAGRRDVLGATLVVGGVPHTIVGVMPRRFQVPEQADLWIARGADGLDEERGAHRYQVFARLKPGVTPAAAAAEMRTIARALEQKYGDTNLGRSVRVEPVQSAMVSGVRRQLLVLFGAVGLVLLVGCTNVASLFLARAAQREREVAVRAALGAARGRLVRQFVTESMLLSLLGGLAGLVVAVVGVRLLLAAAPGAVGGTALPRAGEVRVDLAVIGYLLAVSAAVGILFGVVPSLGLLRGRSSAWLREGARGPASQRRVLRQTLVAAEVALAVLLVSGGVLLAKSYARLVRVEPGFDPSRLVAVPVSLTPARYKDAQAARRFFDRLRSDLAATPGVASVALTYEQPMGRGWTTSYEVADRPPPPRGQEPEAYIRPVSPGYFATAGVQLLAGRDISERDREGAPGAVVVNEAFARRHFPGESAIGKRLVRHAWWPGMPETWEIVGVVKGERFLGLDREPEPATYFSYDQFSFGQMWVVVKTTGDPAKFAPALRAAVWRLDRDIPLDDVRTMEDRLGDTVAAPRFTSRLMAAFAAAALLLAALGIYGVLSYTVAQRTQEIGVRMALGAARRSVVGLVVGQGMAPAAIGLVIGLVAAASLTRVLQSMLFEVSPTDPWVFGGTAALLSAGALLAAYLPARRAARVDP
ncbi:MAG: ABC transporter permease, partial [Gemmatimonadaceae bacterium]